MKSTFLTLVYTLGKFANALNPVLVKGNVFYDSVTNERVFLVGVDYQPLGEQGVDPLVDPDVCARDLFLMQQLGINVMRVYTVDASKDHDECMSMYNAGGIYVMLDVNAGKSGHYLNREQPWITYNSEYATNVFTTMTVFSGYNNLIGFFTGNELINGKISAATSPPYVKAITRDMKAYIAKHLDRPLPIGYSSADNIEYRVETATYMSCGTADDGVNDFYAMNNYQACGKQTIHTSGYDALIEQFKDFQIPLFFSEIGCNQVKRTFGETEFVFGPEMTPKFSGCLVYEWTQEANNYGLVKIDSSGDVKILQDYDVLQTQYAKISNLPKDIPSVATKPRACPPSSQFQYINGSETLPRLDEIEKVIQEGVDAKPGKLTEIELVPTKFTITDSKGNEITDKTPKKRSGLSHIDLSAKVHEAGYGPSDEPKTASTKSSSGSGSKGAGLSGSKSKTDKEALVSANGAESLKLGTTSVLASLACAGAFAALLLF